MSIVAKLKNNKIDSHSCWLSWLRLPLALILAVHLVFASPLVLASDKSDKNKVEREASANNKLSYINPLVQLPGDTIVVRHAPGLNQGRTDGSIRVLLGESTSLNTGLVVTGDLLVPGTPNININGSITYNGTVVGNGNNSPSGYSININSGVSLRHLTTRTDPITISPVLSPPPPQGNQSISLNPGRALTDFSNVRDITLNSNYGLLTVPQGTYGNFTANTNSGFIFGVDGQNTVYNLQGLSLNSSAQLQVRGNVTINLANLFNLGSPSTLGDPNNPIALSLNISGSNLNLNSNSKIYGVVRAPQATVNINTSSILKGSLVCDRLNLNGGLVQGLTSDTTQPTVTITQPQNNSTTSESSITVSGSFSDDSLVNSVKVNGVTATINGNNYTVTVPLNVGSNTLTVSATDIFGNVGSNSISVTRSDGNNQPPQVNTGADQSITLPTTSLTLNGTVTDDGLPQGSTLSITWSTVSSPAGATVNFTNPNAAQTNASFSTAGSYVLKLSASDSQLTGEDTVNITVNQPQNQAPTVNAGQDQTITLPSTASLVGIASDDGLPNPPAQLSVSWSKVSGAGSVSFSNPSSLSTTASFSVAGAYVLRLSVSDSLLSTSDDITVIVNPAQPNNAAPQVSAGPDQSITLPNAVTLNGSVSDDGNPNPPASLSIEWTRVDGPGVVNFTNPNGAITQASFSIAGTYTLRLTANDSALSSSDDVIVLVSAAANQPPTVSAGADQTIVLPAVITLNGSASDDGLPSNNLTFTWSKVSGSSNVSFESPNSLTTDVIFEAAGTYVLRLTASDGQLQSSDDITLNLTLRPRIIIYSNQDGFEPDTTISTQVGEKVLMVRNRTNEDITYVFTQANQSINVSSSKGSNTFINVTLVEGTATLSTLEHPEWALTFSILP